MIRKISGRLSEAQEQTVGVFVLVVIEVFHCSCIHKLVEKPAAVFPYVPIFHEGDIPGAMAHA